MTEKEKNTEIRKLKPLSISEKLSFFFLPFNLGSRLFPTKDFNNTEVERFKKFGFDRKLTEARIFKKYGIIFYILLAIILLLSKNYF